MFTLTETLSLLGLAQCVYVLVYMVLRSGSWRHALIPLAYFFSLSMAFLFDAAANRWQSHSDLYFLWQWALWFAGVPLGTLLVFQVAQTPELPSLKYYLLLLLIPLSLLPYPLIGMHDMMYVAGLVLGALSLLTVWLRRDILDNLSGKSRLGGERFWLILAMIITNVAFLGSTLAYVSNWLSESEWGLVRTFLGIAFVYIGSTSLFRIYPQAVKLDRKPVAEGVLSSDEHILLEKLETLFERDKIYQEPAIGRAEMARELDVGEATLSRIINIHYGKTIPQILNEYRVKDAQRLLKETAVPVQDVFAESGFNSITTFNRVFKELVGDSPKEYRARFRG